MAWEKRTEEFLLRFVETLYNEITENTPKR